VLAAGTYLCPTGNTPGTSLVNAAPGTIFKTLPVGSSRVFGQPAFAQGTLLIATEPKGLYNFAP
jgi:hypothetical protein